MLSNGCFSVLMTAVFTDEDSIPVVVPEKKCFSLHDMMNLKLVTCTAKEASIPEYDPDASSPMHLKIRI